MQFSLNFALENPPMKPKGGTKTVGVFFVKGVYKVGLQQL